MAAKKMFPPGEIDRLLGKTYDEFKLGISFSRLPGQIVMQFSDHVEWIRMSSAGARKMPPATDSRRCPRHQWSEAESHH